MLFTLSLAEVSRPWTVIEQRALEQALKTYPSNAGDSGSDDRWQLIANVVGTRTRRECIIRCKELAEQVSVLLNLKVRYILLTVKYEFPNTYQYAFLMNA